MVLVIVIVLILLVGLILVFCLLWSVVMKFVILV